MLEYRSFDFFSSSKCKRMFLECEPRERSRERNFESIKARYKVRHTTSLRTKH